MRPQTEHKNADIPLALLEQLVHPRIYRSCSRRYLGSDWNGVVHAAMLEVEQALKEVSGDLTPDNAEEKGEPYGKKLIDRVWKLDGKVGLAVPLGNQEAAYKLFLGAFGYYRNYAAHKTADVGHKTCVRAMILASELLDLIHASSRSFIGLGGVDGLVNAGWFKDEDEVKRFLIFLHGQTFPYNTCDGFFESLFGKGFCQAQLDSMFEFGLIRYRSEVINHNLPNEEPDCDECGWLELTQLGRIIAGDVPEEEL